jgi:hypothetical protein
MLKVLVRQQPTTRIYRRDDNSVKQDANESQIFPQRHDRSMIAGNYEKE